MNPVKARLKSLQDRCVMRQESLARLESIQPGDLVKMFGLLAQTLSERRREAELDVFRTERFHPDNEQMMQIHPQQLKSYDRRLEIASGMITMLNVFKGQEALKKFLLQWCKDLPTFPDTYK